MKKCEVKKCEREAEFVSPKNWCSVHWNEWFNWPKGKKEPEWMSRPKSRRKNQD